jgi:hypothetical protein
LKRKSKNRFLSIIIIALIVGGNCIGVSYAYWSKQLKVTTTVNTGYIDAGFEGIPFKISSSGNSLQMSFNSNRTVMYIKGSIKAMKTVNVNTIIRDNGSIPVRLYNNRIEPIVDGFKGSFSLNNDTGLINKNGQLTTISLEGTIREKHLSDIYLIFKPWNQTSGNNDSWENILRVNIDVDVI